MNLACRFLDHNPAEKIAILSHGLALTYGDVISLANRAGNGLRSLGVTRGDRVLLLLPDGPEFVAAWFGAIKIGAVAVPANTWLRTADFDHFLKDSDARVVVFDAVLAGQLVPVLRGRPAIATGDAVAGCIAWSEWIAGQDPALEAEAAAEDDAAFWLWTSGSTGSPKAAVHRHRDWLQCCEKYAHGVLGIGAQDLTFSTSKLFHAYGLGNGLMFPFFAGAATALFPGRAQPRAVLEFAQRVRPTLFFSVPTLYAAMLHEAEAGGAWDLSSVRLAVSAAEPLPAEIYRRWRERFGSEILDGIGSSEVLHIYISERAGAVKPGSSGSPVPGYDIRITDERGKQVERGTAGDLWVRGESVSLGYWNRPQLTADRMQAGWFFTGDKYVEDEDGYFWYAGRSDDMFRVMGEWVSPIEVEAALIEHPAVLECAVVAYRDADELLKPKACVVLKDVGAGTDGLARELQEFVRARIASYKHPRVIEFWDELPKTATGKIQRYKLRS